MRFSPPTSSNQPQLLRTVKARLGDLRQWRSRERTTWTGSPKGERMGMRESISAVITSDSGRFALSSNDSSLSQTRAAAARARQTGRSIDRPRVASEGVNMSRFRWKARPRLGLRYELRMRRVRPDTSAESSRRRARLEYPPDL